MNYLHENLHMACWFKLQSCMFLKPEEHHNVSLVPGHAVVMIHSLKHQHIIDEFNAKTDLLLTSKITRIIFKVKEFYHAILSKSNKTKHQKMFDNMIEKAVSFLPMTIKNPRSCLAKIG